MEQRRKRERGEQAAADRFALACGDYLGRMLGDIEATVQQLAPLARTTHGSACLAAASLLVHANLVDEGQSPARAAAMVEEMSRSGKGMRILRGVADWVREAAEAEGIDLELRVAAVNPLAS